MKQLPLQLVLPPRYGAEDFLVAPCNAAAHATISHWPDWPDPILLLLGDAGSGKTHLAHVWAARSGAAFVGAEALAGAIAAMASQPLVIDGADTAALPEAGLFHLLEHARLARSWLLLTARQPPDLWPIATADVRSRLRLAPAVAIAPPDDALIRGVLVKGFDDRQLIVETALVDYVALRIDRSLAAVRGIVDALDRASLGAGRRITRAMAAEVLRDLGAEAD